MRSWSSSKVRVDRHGGFGVNVERSKRKELMGDGTLHAERGGENARDKMIFQSDQRQGIYTSQTSVIYKWPSEIIKSKCK